MVEKKKRGRPPKVAPQPLGNSGLKPDKKEEALTSTLNKSSFQRLNLDNPAQLAARLKAIDSPVCQLIAELTRQKADSLAKELTKVSTFLQKMAKEAEDYHKLGKQTTLPLPDSAPGKLRLAPHDKVVIHAGVSKAAI